MGIASLGMMKNLWAMRKNDLEFESGQIAEELKFFTDGIKDLTESMTQIDNRLGQLNNRRSDTKGMYNAIFATELSNKLSQGGNQDKNEMMGQLQSEILSKYSNVFQNSGGVDYQINLLNSKKASLETDKKVMNGKEKVLLSKKLQVDTQLKLATQMGPAAEKMESSAIKGFAPNIA